ITREIVKSLITKHHYHAALTMLREIESDPGTFAGPEKIWNGGFEEKITLKDETPFHWYVASSALAQVSLDTNAHSGNGSLRISFKAPNNLAGDRKSTRLNSSHSQISYAVFCLK